MKTTVIDKLIQKLYLIRRSVNVQLQYVHDVSKIEYRV